MFATFAGGYSRLPLPAQPDRLGQAERDLLAGRIDHEAYQVVADGVVREILDEMAVVELGIVGDGGVRARDRVLPWITGLSGLAAGEETTLPDGEAATRPIVTGEIRWHSAITVRDFEFADAETALPVKQALIGPYSLAALAEPSPGPRRWDVALALGEALNTELLALARTGCRVIEVDEPAALQIGGDSGEWAAFHAAQRRLTAAFDTAPDTHLSLGLWGGEIDPAGHGPLLDLPYKSYLVDVLAGPSAWRFIHAVPPELGIILGLADAHSTTLEEAELVVWSMAWAAEGGRGSSRVGVAPNGTLAFVGRHFAHRKAQRLGECVRIGSMGPLEEVAVALDERPLQSRMRALRTMAEAVATARGT